MPFEEYPNPYLNDVFEKLTCWKAFKSLEPEGVITGCDWKMQTMIPWWWKNYNKYHTLPVTFIDLGISDAMRRFCKQHGRVISLNIPKYLLKQRIFLPEWFKKSLSKNEQRRKKLERITYFHKPFALLQTPYRHSVWIDIDCQVQASISPLFHYCEKGLSLTPMSPFKHQNPIQKEKIPKDKTLYNSGVICFKHGDRLIRDWAIASVCRNQWYFGDQDILNHLIYEKDIKVIPLPNRFNWIVKEWGLNPNAEILHYAGLGKWYDHNSFSTFKIQMPKKPYHW